MCQPGFVRVFLSVCHYSSEPIVSPGNQQGEINFEGMLILFYLGRYPEKVKLNPNF